jgi:hypothetical protein
MEPKPPLPLAENERIAQWLRQMAELLHAQQANPFRVGAYRRAADTIERLQVSVRDVLADRGRDGLDELPGIGRGIASVIAEILLTGRWAQLDRLRGSLEPAALFQTVPGVGPELAERIHDALGVETLEALEVASHDGRLDSVPGVGPRRAAAIRAALADILGRSGLVRRTIPSDAAHGGPEPAAALFLDVDREYRDKAQAGALPTIAPRRFNPGGESWLPVLHAHREPWHFTALYSNTARAHELGRTRDWVVIYFHDDDHVERQRTVVTETRGPLQGRRVVRGREAECRAWYEAGGNA